MQRIALDRRRVFGWIWFGIGVAYLVLSVLLVIAEPSIPTAYRQLAIAIVWVIWGAVMVTLARRALRAFESVHGADAGKQSPR